MLRWNWDRKMGEIVVKTMSGKKAKLHIYEGNCLGAIMDEWRDQNDHKVKYRVWGYFNDEEELKMRVGLKAFCHWDDNKTYKENCYKDEWEKFKLNIYYKDALRIAKIVAKAGYKVELYYKEPKQAKK